MLEVVKQLRIYKFYPVLGSPEEHTMLSVHFLVADQAVRPILILHQTDRRLNQRVHYLGFQLIVEAIGRLREIKVLAPFIFSDRIFLITREIHPVSPVRRLDDIEIIDQFHPEIRILDYLDRSLRKTYSYNVFLAAGAKQRGKKNNGQKLSHILFKNIDRSAELVIGAVVRSIERLDGDDSSAESAFLGDVEFLSHRGVLHILQLRLPG